MSRRIKIAVVDITILKHITILKFYICTSIVYIIYIAYSYVTNIKFSFLILKFFLDVKKYVYFFKY